MRSQRRSGTIRRGYWSTTASWSRSTRSDCPRGGGTCRRASAGRLAEPITASEIGLERPRRRPLRTAYHLGLRKSPQTRSWVPSVRPPLRRGPEGSRAGGGCRQSAHQRGRGQEALRPPHRGVLPGAPPERNRPGARIPGPRREGQRADTRRRAAADEGCQNISGLGLKLG